MPIRGPTLAAKMKYTTRYAALVLVLALSACATQALFCGKANCYELLGVERSASKSEIRRAYRRLSVEKHPDKKPGDEAAAEEFRLIGNAYSALKDDEKRAKYNDFLDNPGKYWDFIMQNTDDNYAPKTNIFIAVTLIIGLVTLVNWLNMKNSYKTTIERLRESPEFKREVTRLVKTKAAKNAEEAESMIDLDIVGLEEPDWRNLVIVKLAMLPGHLFSLLKWRLNWVYSYKILKREYSEEDKQYLIQKNLEMSDREWSRLSEPDQKKLFDQKLWEKDEAAEYLRLERIALNRAGKLKKKKKQTNGVTESESMVE